MKSIFLKSHTNQFHLTNLDSFNLPENPIDSLKEEILLTFGIPIEDQTLYHNGRIIHNFAGLERLESGSTIDIGLKLQGGKGGFGSLLRGQAISKRKITNFDASRDLQGRRIRNVKAHQKIMEWVKKRKEEEKLVKTELDDFKKAQKESQGMKRDIKLTQEFKDKVEKWDHEMSNSIRAGLKKAKSENGKVEEFAEPKKKRKGDTEKTKGDGHLDDSITMKLASILEEKADNETILTEKIVVGAEIVTENKNGEGNKPSEVNGKANAEQEKVTYEPIDLATISVLPDLVNLGNDHLKHELMRLGLKAGGSLQERAKRLYDIKLKPELLFSPKYIAKK